MRRSILVLVAALAFSGCAARKAPPAPQPGPVPMPTPPPASAEALADHQGDSTATAVHVPANAPNDGIDFQNNWIYDRFGRFRRRSWAIAHEGEASTRRMYEVVKIELADHSERTVYFDITENWASWKPAAK
jgi:outer membrane protein TolC